MTSNGIRPATDADRARWPGKTFTHVINCGGAWYPLNYEVKDDSDK